ncbi:glycosyltransferase family 15 protein [Sporobolomyces salmoneus]|uniref:glycosyltransferase family 15 protein n=1 Tax=Sporobolomyces salmoneus TaxID=183962 RepID=UPI00317E5789
MSYAPLPTTSDPHHSRPGGNHAPHISLSNLRSHLPTFSSSHSPSNSPKLPFLDQLSPRTVRLLVWIGSGVLFFVILTFSFNHSNSTTSHGSTLDSPRGSRIGEYAWMKGWRGKGGENGVTRFGTGKWNEGLIEPEFVKDEKTGYLMPPDVYPAALNPYKRGNAAFVALVRNNERESMRDSMRSVEMRGNRRWGYPWVFMNDEPFDKEFIDGVKSITRSQVYFHVIPKEHWSYPEWINQTYAAEERQKMVNENVIYGGSESYRHMCRFNSGFFFQQDVLDQFDYYWRVEPGVEFFCDIDFDPFLFMQANEKVYGFTISLYEYRRTVETLWDATREFAKLHPEHIHPDNAVGFLVDDQSKGLMDGEWNNCHFWSNFEIASLTWLRSKPYMDYFNFLDKKGGFFYERWGDAPVHSLAVALFLPKDKIIHLDPISYRHNPYTACPSNEAFRESGKCECERQKDFNSNDGYSCTPRWWDRFEKWSY